MDVYRQPFSRRLVLVLSTDDLAGALVCAVGLVGITADLNPLATWLGFFCVLVGAILIVYGGESDDSQD